MIHRWVLFLFCLIFWAPGPSFGGVLSSIIMKDGSIIHGDINQMVKGKLQVEAPFGAGDPFLIKWEEVQNIATSQSVTLILADGTSINGTLEKGEPGELRLASKPLAMTIPISLSTITAINPPPKKAVLYQANVDFGAKFSEGNAVNKQANLLSRFSARSERLRLRLEARYFYAEDGDKVTDRNAFGSGQLDFFMTKRMYVFLSTLLEQDTFDDLNLRTSVSAGPGYQLIDKGDYASPYFREMELTGDVGLGFFNEDRKIGEDIDFFTWRWSVNLDWPIVDDVIIFHRQQGFPSTEDTSDFYVNTIQGIRFELWNGLNFSLQINYKYNNTPSEGTDSSDVKGLVTIGYAYEN